MPVEVTRETDAEIRAMGWIGQIVERCTDCRDYTRFWAESGKYPLCPACAEKRPDPEETR